MKRLALITPKGVNFSTDEAFADFFKSCLNVNSDSVLMPTKYMYWSGGGVGLLIVAALTPEDIEVEYIDENYEDVNFDGQYDLVGITAMTQQAVRAYEIAAAFREKGIAVVLGGIHATVLPTEAKSHADSVVIGEVENVWQTLIKDFRNGELRPFYQSKSPVDLSQSPLPRYELLKKYDYKMIWVQSTRGCPRKCEFCAASNVYGTVYRRKPVGQILNEINYIRSLWAEPTINFADDNLFVDKAYSRQLVMKLGQTGLKWTAQTDLSVSDDDELLDLLRQSGCRLLFIGFETLTKNGQIDKHGWKQSRIHKYPEVIRKIQSRGIGVLGAFIIGLDSDTHSVVGDVSNFIIDNRLYAAQITVLTPLPGTALRQRLIDENRILSSDWRRYTFEDVNFRPTLMTPEELQRGVLEIYRRVYSKETRMAVMEHFKKIYADLYGHMPNNA